MYYTKLKLIKLISKLIKYNIWYAFNKRIEYDLFKSKNIMKISIILGFVDICIKHFWIPKK
jgi:hypothetical protein